MIDSVFVQPDAAWWKLASDGSYVCAGSKNGLSAWAITGPLLVSQQGDYSRANVFAAPGQVQVELGAAGSGVIETIALPSGISTVGPSFSGQFNSWVLDGSKYLTNEGDTVWAYSSASVQQSIVSLPTTTKLTGQGSWIWTYDASVSGKPLNICAR